MTERTPPRTDDEGDGPYDAALWLLRLIETGVFMDPSEAVFVMLGEQQDLAACPDLRRELLRRTIEAADDDPRASVSAETAIVEMRARLSVPRPPAAVWDASVTRPGAGAPTPAGSANT